ncbi:hypothetical protein BKA70DRAFT_1537223 [Coprinopsis sp. MPI-PUGE-AT-0042]|nr:hypothetical protein BKA70DRAFT_1537223 [Coprinopsis sp. MPI-PUGE-AT-0042]
MTDQLNDFTFTFSLSDASTSFRGSDGRTGTRNERPAPTPNPAPQTFALTQDGSARPAKRARTAADSESEQRVKRPVGRPRRHPLEESFSVEFGSFSLPALDSRPKASAATRKVPLAPIFARKSGPPLPLHASQPTRLEPVQASTSSIYGRLPEVLLPSESCERVISEEHYSDHNNAEPDDEADGSGEGRGDESDTEGDEEDPAELNTGDDLDESAHSGESSSSQREQDATKSKRHRTPLPEWLQSAFNARIEQCKDRNSEGQPRLYWQHKTFWFPNQSSWFILKNSLPSPQRLFNPRCHALTASTSFDATVTLSAQDAVFRSLPHSGS